MTSVASIEDFRRLPLIVAKWPVDGDLVAHQKISD